LSEKKKIGKAYLWSQVPKEKLETAVEALKRDEWTFASE
jgi:hypothetical protein